MAGLTLEGREVTKRERRRKREPEFPPALLKAIAQVKGKRPRTVLQHILKHGHITTEELSSTYGYTHPPRAARDVRELGIPIKTDRVAGSEGRSIARYTIDVEEFERRQRGERKGRRAFPARFKHDLIEIRGLQCELCLSIFTEEHELQVDHRVPYEIGGDPSLTDLDSFMLVCPSCNREKSWRCEHCANWSERNPEICQNCFWAQPTDYTHIATKEGRLIALTFLGSDMDLYKILQDESQRQQVSLEELIKEELRAGYPDALSE
jgi:hypothetical protein